MTMQTALFAIGTVKGSAPKVNNTSSSKSAEGTFDSVINNTSESSVNKTATVKEKSSAVNAPVKANNSFQKMEKKTDDVSMEDVNILNVYMDGSKLQVNVIDNNMAEKMAVIDIDEILETIKELIADKLEVTEDDIESALCESGYTLMDLLDINSLKDFFVSIEGLEEFSDILIDDNSANRWSLLQESIENVQITLDEAVEISAEELVKLIEMADDNVVEVVEVSDSGLVNVEDNTEQSVTIDSNPKSDDSEPQVIVNVSNDETHSADEEAFDSRQRMTGEQTEAIKSEKVQNTDDSGSANQESLFSQFMNRVEANSNPESLRQIEVLQQMRSISNQVIDSIRINVTPATQGLEIQLNPEALGKVNVQIEMREGVATANFIVRNEMARVALENQLQTLKETFDNQGLKVESIEVTVSDFSFENNSNEWGRQDDERQRKRRPFREDDEEDTGLFSINQSTDDMLTQDGGINITA